MDQNIVVFDLSQGKDARVQKLIKELDDVGGDAGGLEGDDLLDMMDNL